MSASGDTALPVLLMPADITAIMALAADGTDRVNAVTYQGHRYWVKRVVPAKGTRWHALQGFVARVFLRRWPILLPTASAGGGAALRAEGGRLLRFAEAGIAAPDMVAVSDELLVMGDAGAQMKDMIDRITDPARRCHYVTAAAAALGRLHAAGLCHGRPQLKDMAWRADDTAPEGGVVAFLDLEEEPEAVMLLPQAQARDAWLFMGAAARYAAADDADYWAAVVGAYNAHAPQTAQDELRALVRGLRGVRKIAGLIAPHAGKDVRQAVIANMVLERALAV